MAESKKVIKKVIQNKSLSVNKQTKPLISDDFQIRGLQQRPPKVALIQDIQDEATALTTTAQETLSTAIVEETVVVAEVEVATSTDDDS